MCYKVAHELGIDEDIVASWSIAKVRGWLTYFQVDNELQREAMDNYKAELDSKRRVPQSRPGVRVTHGADIDF